MTSSSDYVILNIFQVYIFYELYNLFNIIDENRYNRQTTTKIRHQHLYRAYCKANEVIKGKTSLSTTSVLDHIQSYALNLEFQAMEFIFKQLIEIIIKMRI